MKPRLATFAVGGASNLSAASPEMETSEYFDIVARSVMEFGIRVKEAAFCPVIRLVAGSSRAESNKISIKIIAATEIPPSVALVDHRTR